MPYYRTIRLLDKKHLCLVLFFRYLRKGLIVSCLFGGTLVSFVIPTLLLPLSTTVLHWDWPWLWSPRVPTLLDRIVLAELPGHRLADRLVRVPALPLVHRVALLALFLATTLFRHSCVKDQLILFSTLKLSLATTSTTFQLACSSAETTKIIF